VHNPGGLKVHTSTSLASNLKGCGDVAGRRVKHVKRSLQTANLGNSQEDYKLLQMPDVLTTLFRSAVSILESEGEFLKNKD